MDGCPHVVFSNTKYIIVETLYAQLWRNSYPKYCFWVNKQDSVDTFVPLCSIYFLKMLTLLSFADLVIGEVTSQLYDTISSGAVIQLNLVCSNIYKLNQSLIRLNWMSSFGF